MIHLLFFVWIWIYCFSNVKAGILKALIFFFLKTLVAVETLNASKHFILQLPKYFYLEMCCKLVCMFLQVTMCWDATFWQCKWHFWSEPSDRISSELHGPLQLTERISFWLSFTGPLVWRNESGWVSRSLFTSRVWWVLELSITCPLDLTERISFWLSFTFPFKWRNESTHSQSPFKDFGRNFFILQ